MVLLVSDVICTCHEQLRVISFHMYGSHVYTSKHTVRILQCIHERRIPKFNDAPGQYATSTNTNGSTRTDA
jgi:hypothetical protein